MDETLTKAAANGHFQIVKFLVEEGEFAGIDEAIDQAVKHRHLDIAEYLIRYLFKLLNLRSAEQV